MTSGTAKKGGQVPSPMLSDKVYDLLLEDLVSGLMMPGEPLGEEAMCEQYRVSRTPLRAALWRLGTDGLVDIRPKAGAVVRDITVSDVRQIFQVRQALEGLAADVAVTAADQGELKALASVYRSPGSHAAVGPEVLHYTSDTKLHQLIVDALGNRRIAGILRQQSLPIARLRALYWRMADPRVDAVLEERHGRAAAEHLAIAEALLARSAKARPLLVEHLQRGAEHLIHLMASIDLDVKPSGRVFMTPSRRIEHDHSN